MKTILLTGGNGFLGQHLSYYLFNAGYDIVATGRGESRLFHKKINYYECDLANQGEVKAMLYGIKPDIIIHNAAMSKPDECNNQREDCVQANVGSTGNLLSSQCNHFIYISTDFVFGENGPHSENDIPAPLNFYGETKLMAEQLVRESGNLHTIVRPVFIYGKMWEGMRPSFLHWVKKNLEEERPIKVTSDQYRTPTYVGDICYGIKRIIEKNADGIFHLAGKDILTPFEMAISTAEILTLNTSLIEKVTAETFPEPVIRAKRSGLKIEKAIKELDYSPVSFEEGVRLTFGLVS